MGTGSPPPARKVMVVADPSRESAGAFQYALSNVVLENDELILFHAANPNSWRNTFSFLKRPSVYSYGYMMSNTATANSSAIVFDGVGCVGIVGGGEVDFLEVMKQVCEIVHPELHVRVERTHLEAKDKAKAILDKTKSIGVDLLIVGQRRSLSNVLLGSYRRSGASGTRGVDTAEYLIENSKCTCVGVQKKGQNAGNILNTKTQRNFWLLA
ncbi:hypothetical protein K2173_000058 [Erythroxylum novogranatense]|uniref:UspA domain-containing protein n=1 Tax=Erythroxylum novogranatense TaxID=1862640 RepID=A0AAV8SPB8_9ROSI|nr:hypothetical protein K2173_000058 [Erythroxylum novogranatense]